MQTDLLLHICFETVNEGNNQSDLGQNNSCSTTEVEYKVSVDVANYSDEGPVWGKMILASISFFKLTLQFSGGTKSCVISPPCTQKMCFISPEKMSQIMTEKSTPPETKYL